MIPRFLNERSTSFEQSASSSGRIVGSDVDQRDLGAERVEDVGELAAHRAGADDDDRLRRLLEDERFVGRDDRSSCSARGRPAASPFTREPVAMMTAFFASCFSSFPSAVLTETLFLPASFAVPLIHVILFFLNRNSTPLEFCELTPRDRFIATP